jgi:coenzyme F420 hydrogenase subunit beta
MPSPLSAQDHLVHEILDKGLCSACGACLDLCPYFTFFEGQVIATDRCSLPEGRCRRFCPQIPPEMPWEKPDLGPVREKWMVRAATKGVRTKGQYGGTVSALILLALELGWIGGAILTKSRKTGEPEGRICRTRSEVLACAGSKFTGSGTLKALNQALREGEGSLALVGVPCQIQALRRMEDYQEEQSWPSNPVALAIGLFCTWSLPYRAFQALLRENNITASIIKCDIPPPPAEKFTLATKDKMYALPLAPFRSRISKACLRCGDMTAEGADVAVGAAEGYATWNTLIIRSEQGLELFKEARKAQVLEVKPLPEENWSHLQEAARVKKQRAAEKRKEGHG